jgi:diguanylate cyclase (GGDEF)-like protein
MTNDAGDAESSQRDFWIVLLRARALCTVLLPAALIPFTSFGPGRHLVAVLAGLVGVAANLTMLRRLRAGRSLRGHLAVTDIATVLTAMAFLPAAYPAGVILLVSITSLYLFWFGGEFAARFLVPTSAALLLIGWAHQPDMWLAIWLAWVTTASMGAVPISRLAAVAVSLRNRYDDMVNGIDAMVWESTGASHDAVYMSDGVTELLGLRAEELRSFDDLLARVAPEDRDAVLESRRQAATGEDVEVHYRLLDADGRHRHMHERIRCSEGGERRGPLRRGIAIDETARWEAEHSVRSYAEFVEGLPMPLTILRLDDESDAHSFRVVLGNPASAALLEVEPDELVGRRLVDLVDLGDRLLEALADAAREARMLELPNIRSERFRAVFAIRAVPLGDRCIGLMVEDVTARVKRSNSLEHQATHDHLTGLPNRAMFGDRLGRALDRSRRDGGGTALLMVDLNQFKEVNDSLGHDVGDELLIELARRLSNETRYFDTVARLGGDEFAVLIADTADEESALGAANRVLELCREPFVVDGLRLQVGASIGIALAPEHAHDPRSLTRCADRAMYRAKENGAGVVVYSPAQDESGFTRIGLLTDLRAAVTSEEVVVHYQPRIEVLTGRTVGVEALVRWSHPRRGLLSPSDFIELAEVSGEIDALTRTITTRATAELSRFGGGHPLPLNVNLSARSLGLPTLPSWVRSLLERRRLDPSALCFEINERQLIEHADRAAEGLHALAEMGVRLSIDDFGTGGSSVAFLRELPVHELKIDHRFVAGVEEDPTIVRSMIDLGHNLGLHVVAEGVESRGTLELLAELGCDSAQGFHLGRPMSLDELADHFRAATPTAEDPTAGLNIS